MLELEIELLSPLCSGSGLNRPGVVDREVAFDAAGLPVIPGRRLKYWISRTALRSDGKSSCVTIRITSDNSIAA